MNQKPFPEPVEALLVTLGVFFGLISLILIYAAIAGNQLDPTHLDKSTRLIYIFGGSLFLLIPFLYSRSRGYASGRLFRFHTVPWPVALHSVFIGVATTVLVDELDRLIATFIPMPDWLEEQVQPLLVESTSDWLLVLLGAVIIAAIAEEALFRGFFQVTLEQKGDATRAVMFSAITWTIIHMNPYWFVQILVMGIIMGYLSWRSDSVWPAVIVHGVNNLIAVLFLNLNLEEKMAWYNWGDHVSPLLVVLAAAVLVWSVRQINQLYRTD